MVSHNKNSSFVSSGVSNYGRQFYKKWWMGAFSQEGDFLGIISFDDFPYKNKASVKRNVKKMIRAKAKKMGVKVVGELNYG